LVLATVLTSLPLRAAGAPRWLNNPIARTQERWLPVVHIAGLGGDLVVSATLAAVSASLALLLTAAEGVATASLASLSLLAAVGGALAYGSLRLRRAKRSVDHAPRVRIAAIAANVPAPQSGHLTGHWALQSPLAHDVALALSRYAPHIERAVAAGAELVLLPECAVVVDERSRGDWLDTLATWAERERLAIIAPFFDRSLPRNELAVFDAMGRLVGTYEKQHPGPRIEPKRSSRVAPGPHHVPLRSRVLPLSTVICVDNDYADLVPTARSVGGVLCVPANDWPVFETLHHQTAVWSAVLSGVPVLRSTGHGICAVYDGAGRVISEQSSLVGPVVLVVDVPLAPTPRGC
jgi:apolipoprotein N-acyltransferase